MQNLKAVGGMKITCAPGHGADRLNSFAYTTGFTCLGNGAKEYLIQGEHRSAIDDKSISNIFNSLYQQRKLGQRSVNGGDTIEFGDDGIIYKAISPDPVEAALLKATKTLEATRLYGLAGYEILCLVPIAERRGNRSSDDLTGLEMLMLATGLGSFSEEYAVDGFVPIRSGQMRKCANCNITETQLQRDLLRCCGCKDSFYCSKNCQKSHWKVHKKYCGKPRSGEDQVRDHCSFLDPKEQDLVVETMAAVGEGLRGAEKDDA